jgi:nucleoside-diphosphate-sugar epimerase
LAFLLVLGGGYIGAALAELALTEGDRVTIADNWYATERAQLSPLERQGARVETADIRDRDAVRGLLDPPPDRVFLLAAQASRPLSFTDPEYTEQTNLVGPRLVAEELAAAEVGALVYASTLHVYGPSPNGEISADHPVGPQRDLSHLSKVYTELLLRMEAERHNSDLAILRLGVVYGPSPVEHQRPESQTVVDKFRRLAAAGEPLPIDDGGASVGVVHVADAARILHSEPSRHGVSVANVAAESVTVADIAALAEGREPTGRPRCAFATPFQYAHRLADYLGQPNPRLGEARR